MNALGFRDHLFFLAATVYMEAGNQPYLGKLGVAYVICNRAGSVEDVLLKAKQFSCWNTDSPTRMNLDSMPNDSFIDCYKAACAAYFKLADDPTQGATNYLNPVITAAINNGVMPSWYDPQRITLTVGDHEFLKLA